MQPARFGVEPGYLYLREVAVHDVDIDILVEFGYVFGKTYIYDDGLAAAVECVAVGVYIYIRYIGGSGRYAAKNHEYKRCKKGTQMLGMFLMYGVIIRCFKVVCVLLSVVR